MGWLRRRASGVRYRVGGFPQSIAYFRHPSSRAPADMLRHVYARRYWATRSANEVLDVAVALLLLPMFVVGAAIWHTARCGATHARLSGRPVVLQFIDQLRLYAVSGVMPATYYIFSLPERPTASWAKGFLKRAETKGLLYPMVRQRMLTCSSLNDKAEFEKRCRRSAIPVIESLAVIGPGQALDALPKQDLFVKPLAGKGGRGAERWLWTGDGCFESASGARARESQLIDHLARRARQGPLIIQDRVINHESLSDLNCGALATFRVLTCLNSAAEPEVVGAALRMPARRGTVVDNLHGGGITAAVDLETGRLGPATNLGKDPKVGWLDRHPVTGAPITGRLLGCWAAVSELALRGHRAFGDRLFVGWDIAMAPDGPVIVEGNSSPDLDILQRSTRTGMASSRFAELLAERVRQWRLCEHCCP